jgi:hypothetical protein
MRTTYKSQVSFSKGDLGGSICTVYNGETLYLPLEIVILWALPTLLIELMRKSSLYLYIEKRRSITTPYKFMWLKKIICINQLIITTI